MSGVRETQRRAWREAVARAAEEWQKFAAQFRDRPDGRRWSHTCRVLNRALGAGGATDADELGRLDLALSAPKPWTRPAKADLGKWQWSETLRASKDILVRYRGYSEESIASMRHLRRKRRAARRRRR